MLTEAPPTVTFEHLTDTHQLTDASEERVRFIDVPERRCLAIDGTQQPGAHDFQAAIGCLFGVGSALHFEMQRRGVDVPVGHLEALYWFTPEELMAAGPTAADPGVDRAWRWRLLLGLPNEATEDEIDGAIEECSWKRQSPELARLYVDRWAEGRAAQILHVGPYEAEGPTIRRLHEAIAAAGLRPHGQHHEIYLNDPNHVASAEIRTVLVQPVE